MRTEVLNIPLEVCSGRTWSEVCLLWSSELLVRTPPEGSDRQSTVAFCQPWQNVRVGVASVTQYVYMGIYITVGNGFIGCLSVSRGAET